MVAAVDVDGDEVSESLDAECWEVAVTKFDLDRKRKVRNVLNNIVQG